MIEYTVKVYSDGVTYWYLNNKCHREDGPAVDYHGDLFWYRNNLRHREDGPAIEYADGTKRWFLYGEQFSEEEFLRRTSPEFQVIKDLRVIAEKYGYKLTKE